MALDVDKIAQVGLSILNEVGLDGLSTRRLAAEMNVKGPALYKHFRSKADLLDYMATAMLRTTFADLDPTVHWTDWLRDLAAASRAGIRQYRDGARLLLASSPAGPLRSQLIPSLAHPLMAAGFEEHSARRALATLASFVVGWMLNEQNEGTRNMMGDELRSVQGAFDEGVETIVAGLVFRRTLASYPVGSAST
ncbi:MAG: TetR family transcriptional regulator [Sphingomonas bacterium]|nr:TetR family transcriptional regulator [Sphingomonas bacterium]MDB5718793.1 TetR family transcriptional regulator [Sphingomonas bacterium]